MNKELQDIIQTALPDEIIVDFSGNGLLTTNKGNRYFLKWGKNSRIYQCEANGLQELAKAQAIRIVKVISAGDNYILTEYIEHHPPKRDFFEQFGKEFARLHRYKGLHYGFYEDNFIGANEQINMATEEEKTDWISFYWNKRLFYQYKLAQRNGFVTDKLKKDFSNLESKIESILKESIEPPCILHGDLWSGNFICNSKNNPVLIDPAVYYGHREADLAMTKVFGGFPSEFYESYNNEYSLKPDWEYREGIYKLYHILNHLNIFGRSYLRDAESLLMMYM